MPGASKSITIQAPIEKVFSVVSDYASYPQVMPEVKSVRVGPRAGNQVDVHYEINLIKTVKYSLRMTEESPSRLSWTFIEGELMKENKGSWVLESLGGAQTKATYNVELSFGMLVPIPKSVINALVESNLPNMLNNVKKRAEGA